MTAVIIDCAALAVVVWSFIGMRKSAKQIRESWAKIRELRAKRSVDWVDDDRLTRSDVLARFRSLPTEPTVGPTWSSGVTVTRSWPGDSDDQP